MFFLIRCVFWLTIVYMTIFSPDSPKSPQPRSQQAARPLPSAAQTAELAQAWFSSAVAVIEDEAARQCAKTPAECIALAKHWSDMGDQRRVDGAPRVTQSPLTFAHVPLPPRRPHALTSEKAGPGGLEKSSREEYVMTHTGRG